MITAVFGICAIGWSMRGFPWLQFFLAGGVLSLVAYFIWRAFHYAEANPSAALLEGSDLVQMRQLEMAAKGQTILPPTPNTPAPQMIEATSLEGAHD